MKSCTVPILSGVVFAAAADGQSGEGVEVEGGGGGESGKSCC